MRVISTYLSTALLVNGAILEKPRRCADTMYSKSRARKIAKDVKAVNILKVNLSVSCL